MIFQDPAADPSTPAGRPGAGGRGRPRPPEDRPRHRPGSLTPDDDTVELRYSGTSLAFSTPTGKSASTSPQDCRSAARANPLPARVPVPALAGNDPPIKAGDRLCTVTTSGNLALWRITGVSPSENGDRTPVYAGQAHALEDSGRVARERSRARRSEHR